MGSIDLLFCTNPRNPLSWLIRTGSWSRWSHVGILDGDYIIESVALRGVVRTPIKDRQREDRTWTVAALPCSNPDGVIAAALSQLGKPYDYTAILGLGFHREWQEDDSWFCSELVAEAFERAGCRLFRPDSLHRVTPQHLWMLPPLETA